MSGLEAQHFVDQDDGDAAWGDFPLDDQNLVHTAAANAISGLLSSSP